MDRTKFFRVVTVDGIQELDLMDNNLPPFEFKQEPLYYRIMQSDSIAAPDLIAYKIYKEERYWWVLALANNIACTARDIVVGELWKIPNLLDVYDFYKKFRVR